MIVYFILGLQGVGKSRYIAEHHPDALQLDIEHWWDHVKKELPELSFFEAASWTKHKLRDALYECLLAKAKEITVEITGITDASWRFVTELIAMAWRNGYEVEIVYLQVADYNSYLESIDGDRSARDMFRAFVENEWVEPCDRYFLGGAVHTIQVDHSQWTWEEKKDRWQE